eukprot:gene31471-39585_t
MECTAKLESLLELAKELDTCTEKLVLYVGEEPMADNLPTVQSGQPEEHNYDRLTRSRSELASSSSSGPLSLPPRMSSLKNPIFQMLSNPEHPGISVSYSDPMFIEDEQGIVDNDGSGRLQHTSAVAESAQARAAWATVGAEGKDSGLGGASLGGTDVGAAARAGLDGEQLAARAGGAQQDCATPPAVAPRSLSRLCPQSPVAQAHGGGDNGSPGCPVSGEEVTEDSGGRLTSSHHRGSPGQRGVGEAPNLRTAQAPGAGLLRPSPSLAHRAGSGLSAETARMIGQYHPSPGKALRRSVFAAASFAMESPHRTDKSKSSFIFTQ